MKVVDATQLKSQPFDVPSAFAAVLIKANLVVEWHPPVPVANHNLVWEIRRYSSGRPYIFGNCGGVIGQTEDDNGSKINVSCNPRFRYEGREPEKVIFHHCTQPVAIPADIAERYMTLARPFFESPTSHRTEEAPVRVPVL